MLSPNKAYAGGGEYPRRVKLTNNTIAQVSYEIVLSQKVCCQNFKPQEGPKPEIHAIKVYLSCSGTCSKIYSESRFDNKLYLINIQQTKFLSILNRTKNLQKFKLFTKI